MIKITVRAKSNIPLDIRRVLWARRLTAREKLNQLLTVEAIGVDGLRYMASRIAARWLRRMKAVEPTTGCSELPKLIEKGQVPLDSADYLGIAIKCAANVGTDCLRDNIEVHALGASAMAVACLPQMLKHKEVSAQLRDLKEALRRKYDDNH